MTDDPIDYEQWIEDALRTVVRRALCLVEKEGLPGEHHFYITFRTTAEGVDMPGFLRAQYPEEITIVLQHQFEGLEVAEDYFQVTLRFGGRPARLRVPFAAVSAFTDPSVKFGLQYTRSAAAKDEPAVPAATAAIVEDKASESASEDAPGDDEAKTGEVIALDSFRKK